MFLNLLNIIKDMLFFTGSYSNQVFPDPLSNEEEEHTIEEMLKGSIDARNKLIEHNLRLVAHIVKKFDNTGYDSDDLISIGTIGLIKGIDSYNKSKATKITTYAARCIENEILMHFRSNKKNGNTISLNDAIGFDKDGNEVSLMEVIKDDSMDIAELLHIKENVSLLNKYLSVLTKREKEILIKRYGLLNEEEETQKEIAKKLHISRSYVSRIEKRALTKILREFIKNNKVL
ncbi:MAG: RNA polymerase sporulation sigma factor SigK [Firmicutes bacterium]|nr:RNA polymerase sporulation sigma factor SigK [Bacillota bacterium]